MIYFVCGLGTMICIWFVIGAIRKRGISLGWGHRILVGTGFLLLGFTLAVIAAFLEEGAPRGALVMGSLLGVVTVVWGAGTARLIRRKKGGEGRRNG